jgi:riboflavin transporter FmnP
MFAIPILMASVLLRPYASFLYAILTSLIITVIGNTIPGTRMNVPAILAFFVFATVSWLSTHSLETARRDLRTINAE